LAAKIEKKYRIKPDLIEGKGGVFEVEVDGKLVFSKKREGRFPVEEEEIFPFLERRA
jgi:selT/selW/selH-like putative selenoprotein